jgi:uncharacterized membrane protein
VIGRPGTRRAPFAIAVLAVLGLALGAGPLYAKSFSFPRVVIEAAVGTDGSLQIVETRTYRFSGAFLWASYRLPLPETQRMHSIAVADDRGAYRESGDEQPGTFTASRSGDTVEIRWHFRASDESRAFVISYVVDDVVTVHSDVAELYWKFIGTGWEQSTDDVRVTVRLPGAVPADQIRVWGHGPLQGNATRVDGGAVFALRGLPPKTMVEGRVLFPREVVAGARLRSTEPGLPRILKEEGDWADQANRRRALMRAAMYGMYALPVLAIAGWLWLYVRYGREPVPGPPEGYYRELPADYSPAELGVLWRFGSVQPADFSATVLDLARRGYLEVRTGTEKRLLSHDETYTLTRTAKEDGLRPFEREALGILFEAYHRAGTQIKISHSQGLPGDAKSRMRRRYPTWSSLVSKAADAYGFFDQTSMRMRWAALLLGFLLAFGGWWAFVGLGLIGGSTGLAAAGLATIGSGIVMAAGSGAVRRRSQRGADDLRQWQGFRRFLLDFSEMPRAELPALTLWEQYLVYAVPLGVAHRVIDQLRKIYPAAELEATPGLRMWSGSGPGGGNALGTIGAFTTAIAAATSSATSSSGGGGGFSGGGGGGGGGSGGSAG